jgi:hypothetical protein
MGVSTTSFIITQKSIRLGVLLTFHQEDCIVTQIFISWKA